MEKEIFRVGDKVFDIRYGWGTIIKYNATQNYPIEVKFDKNDLEEIIRYTKYGKDYKLDDAGLLSFTEYDLVNGGFSQERPINYKDYMDKWGKFWNMENKEDMVIKKLYKHIPYTTNLRFQCLIGRVSMCYKNFEPLTDEQVKILNLE